MVNKAFVKETDQEDEEPEKKDFLPINTKNYVTPSGFMNLQNELKHLVQKERPHIVEIVRWAASNGDRSENGDYIYGKRRLREIDKRIRYLTKRIETAEIVNPQLQINLTKVFFGATVTYATKDGNQQTMQIVGIDEADLEKNKISWISPLAKSLIKSEVGDTVKFKTPTGIETLTILSIQYLAA